LGLDGVNFNPHVIGLIPKIISLGLVFRILIPFDLSSVFIPLVLSFMHVHEGLLLSFISFLVLLIDSASHPFNFLLKLISHLIDSLSVFRLESKHVSSHFLVVLIGFNECLLGGETIGEALGLSNLSLLCDNLSIKVSLFTFFSGFSGFLFKELEFR